MTYYAHINTQYNTIGKGQCPCSGDNIVCLEITEEVYNNIDRYMYNGTELVLDPDYEQKQAQKERERVAKLSMTPLDFLKAIANFGITYAMVKQIMETNSEVEMEMKFCQNVYRGHPMINQFAEQFGVTQEQLDYIFKKANGEVD